MIEDCGYPRGEAGRRSQDENNTTEEEEGKDEQLWSIGDRQDGSAHSAREQAAIIFSVDRMG